MFITLLNCSQFISYYKLKVKLKHLQYDSSKVPNKTPYLLDLYQLPSTNECKLFLRAGSSMSVCLSQVLFAQLVNLKLSKR